MDAVHRCQVGDPVAVEIADGERIVSEVKILW